jgi:mannosyltransferase
MAHPCFSRRVNRTDQQGRERTIRTLGDRANVFLPILTGLIAATICAIGSDRVSLWKDEVDSISASTRSVPDLGRLVVHIDAVHGLYYLLLHVWTSAFGQDPWVLRLLSAIAVGVAAAGVWCLAAHVFDRRTAVLATVIFAVLPRITWAGIEARSYALTATAGVWLTYSFLLARERPTRGRWIRYAVAAAASIALNIFLTLVVVAHGLALLADRVERRRVMQWLLAAAGGAIVAGPVLVETLRQRGQLGAETLAATTVARSTVVNQWFLGQTPDNASGVAVLWAPAAVLLALLCWALVISWVVRTVRRPDSRDRSVLATFVAWLVVPTAVVALYSVGIHQLYNSRYFCFSVPALAILAGRALRLIDASWLRRVVLVAIVALTVPVYASQRAVEAKDSDWSVVAAYLHAHPTPDAGIYFTPRYPPTSTTVMATARYAAVGYPAPYRPLRDITLLTTPAADHSLTGRSLTLQRAAKRLAGLSTVWVLRRRDYPTDEAASDQRVLERSGFRPVGKTVFTFDELLRYRRTESLRHH